MADWTLTAELALWITQLASPLHGRLRGRLLPVFTGMLFAQGRKTVAGWLRAAGLGRDYQAYYYFLGSLGRKARSVATLLLQRAVAVVDPGGRVLCALDDTPTRRYGPKVQGAGVHHNPTPGPAEQKFLYGHVWVTAAWVVRHPLWGAIGLPLRALLYVRRKQIASIPRKCGVAFRTKLEQGAELVEWLAAVLRVLGKPLWVAADGAYAKKPFLKRATAAGVVVVSRLRRDAALRGLPTPPRRGAPARRGRKPKYGRAKISLAKRAGHRRGWTTDEFTLYGKKVAKTYKTFLATYVPAGGVIRVVLVREESAWAAFFSTRAEASPTEILEAVADRAAIEQDFYDFKEVRGTSEQQPRYYWATVAAFHLTLWLRTLVELWAWRRSHRELVDRGPSPWDDSTRRPSHADRCKALRRSCIRAELTPTRTSRRLTPKIRAVLRRLLRMVS